MDPLTIIGIVLCLVFTYVASTMGGIDPIGIFFMDIGSIILVFGGSIGGTLASGTMDDAKNMAKWTLKGLMPPKEADRAVTIQQLLGFAETARKEGLLALESAAKQIEDPFLRKGIEMSVDGTDPEVVREVLETEMSATQARHKTGAGFFVTAAGYAPAFGVAGTVIGLMAMLGNLSDPAALGPALAVAFATTLWGVFLANYIYLPLANTLKRSSELEMAYKELILEGIIAIQAGASPRAVSDRLMAYLTPAQQESIREKKSA